MLPSSLFEADVTSPPRFDRIHLISAYCDRWCERCGFTSRCQSYAIDAAAAMCGDFREGLRLALPRPPTARRTSQPDVSVAPASGMTAERSAAITDREKRIHRAVNSDELTIQARTYSQACLRWMWRRRGLASRDQVIAEALRIVDRDSLFIASEIRSALESRLRHQLDPDALNPAHCDGLAKTALISIERSSHAWRAIGQLGWGDSLAALVLQLHDLREAVCHQFQNAWRFVRPGFDEPWRR